MRLDKLLSHLGYGSRKIVKTFIRKGHVMVNGVIITDDDFCVDEINDEIIFNETKLEYEAKIYLLMNKPKNVICATVDNYTETVIDLVGEYASMGVFPVGRLDKDSEGLLLLTNDGELAHQLLSPKKHVTKTYYVELDAHVPTSLIQEFKNGVKLADYKCQPAILANLKENSCEVSIVEGKFHQVKKMFQTYGLTVTRLVRIRFANLVLDETLAVGEYRKITKEMII